MRPFYLFRRDNGVIYVQFQNEAMHMRTSAKSTHETNMARAMTVACDWMQNGIPVKERRQNVTASIAINTIASLASEYKFTADDMSRLSDLLKKYDFDVAYRARA